MDVKPSAHRSCLVAMVALSGAVGCAKEIRDQIDPAMPELTLHLRHVSVETGKTVRPEFAQVWLHRWYGTIQPHTQNSGLDDEVLDSVLSDREIAKLRHYVPRESSDKSKYFYRLVITQYMQDALESVVFELRGLEIRGEALPGCESVRRIQPDGSVQIDVPYRHPEWQPVKPSPEKRLLGGIETLTADGMGSVRRLSVSDRRRLADWVIGHLERISSVIKDEHTITSLKGRWQSIRDGRP